MVGVAGGVVPGVVADGRVVVDAASTGGVGEPAVAAQVETVLGRVDAAVVDVVLEVVGLVARKERDARVGLEEG